MTTGQQVLELSIKTWLSPSRYTSGIPQNQSGEAPLFSKTWLFKTVLWTEGRGGAPGAGAAWAVRGAPSARRTLASPTLRSGRRPRCGCDSESLSEQSKGPGLQPWVSGANSLAFPMSPASSPESVPKPPPANGLSSLIYRSL